MSRWRVGRSTGRTLWRDEQLVGMVDSPEVAAEIVEALNAWQNGTLPGEVPRAPEGDCADGCTRHAACRPESSRERSLAPGKVAVTWSCCGSHDLNHQSGQCSPRLTGTFAAWRCCGAPLNGPAHPLGDCR